MNDTTKNIIEDEQQLRSIIREEVAAALEQILHDPDRGKELREEFADRLKESKAQIEAGETVPFSEVKKNIG